MNFLLFNQINQFYFLKESTTITITTLTILFNLTKLLTFIYIIFFLSFKAIHYLISRIQHNRILVARSRRISSILVVTKLLNCFKLFKVFISNEDLIEFELFRNGTSYEVVHHSEVGLELEEDEKKPKRKKTLLFGVGFEAIYWLIVSSIQYVNFNSDKGILLPKSSLFDSLCVHSNFLTTLTWVKFLLLLKPCTTSNTDSSTLDYSIHIRSNITYSDTNFKYSIHINTINNIFNNFNFRFNTYFTLNFLDE